MLLWAMGWADAGELVWCPVPERGRTTIQFTTGAEAAALEAKRATAEMRAPVPMPPMGYVVVQIERVDIRFADPGDQLVILTDAAGVELGRVQPESKVPNVPEGQTLWWAQFSADVPYGAGSSFPLTVHVVDKYLGERCTWNVDAAGVVSGVRVGWEHVELTVDGPVVSSTHPPGE